MSFAPPFAVTARDDFAASFAQLPTPVDEWGGRHVIGRGGTTLAALAQGQWLDTLVQQKQRQAMNGDARLGCAYLVAEIAWQLGTVFGGLWLTGWRVRTVDPAAVALTPRAVIWADAENGTAWVCDLSIDAVRCHSGGAEVSDFTAVIAGLMQDMVAALATLTGLGAAAQWRQIGDGVCGAILAQGKALGRMGEAVALANAIIADRTTRLGCKQAELVEIAVPNRIGATEWFLLRGGCCRYYTSDGGEYCSTCIHRSRDDRIARLEAFLAGR